MGFNRIFNWLRFIAVPPSYLFNNRLFLEKNARNKKIFNNFGWVYKSNSWSISRTSNLKISFFKKNLSSYLIISLSLLLLYLALSNYAVFFFIWEKSIATNYFFFFIWRIFDYCFFLLLNLFFIGLTFFSFLTKGVVSFFYPNFKSNKFLRPSHLDERKPTFFFKKVDNKALLSYLYKNNKYLILENLFNSTHSDSIVLLKFYKKIFTINFFISNSKFRKNTSNSLILNNFAFSVDYLLYKKSTTSPNNKWELGKLSKNYFNFFISKANQGTSSRLANLNSEFFFINTGVSINFKKLEYFKWLYKYSILHSRALYSLDKTNLKVYNLGLRNINSSKYLNNLFYTFYNKNILNNLYVNYLKEGSHPSSRSYCFKSNINLNFLNNYSNWESSYGFLTNSNSWLFLRARFLARPRFNSLKFYKKNKQGIHMIRESFGELSQNLNNSNHLLLLNFFKNNNFYRKNQVLLNSSKVSLGFKNIERFSLIDKNILLFITENKGSTLFFKYSFFRNYNTDHRFMLKVLNKSYVLKSLLTNKCLFGSKASAHLYKYFI